MVDLERYNRVGKIHLPLLAVRPAYCVSSKLPYAGLYIKNSVHLTLTKESIRRNTMKKFIEEFKAFALRGNVMDMAVGVIIGGAL
jgi:hypothetical protein